MFSVLTASNMVFTQPVVHEFGKLQVPTLLIIGEKDNTAIGKAQAPEELLKELGRYDVLGEQAAEAIPDATLVKFPDLGHSPQIQAPECFHEALFKGLANESPPPFIRRSELACVFSDQFGFLAPRFLNVFPCSHADHCQNSQ